MLSLENNCVRENVNSWHEVFQNYFEEGPERRGGGVQIPFPSPNFAQIPVPSPIFTTNPIPRATNPNAS